MLSCSQHNQLRCTPVHFNRQEKKTHWHCRYEKIHTQKCLYGGSASEWKTNAWIDIFDTHVPKMQTDTTPLTRKHKRQELSLTSSKSLKQIQIDTQSVYAHILRAYSNKESEVHTFLVVVTLDNTLWFGPVLLPPSGSVDRLRITPVGTTVGPPSSSSCTDRVMYGV